MSKSTKSAGVFQLDNGMWGYRFVITVNGKQKTQKRTLNDAGKPFKSEEQAIKAREKHIKLARKELTSAPQKNSPSPVVRKTIEEVYNEYCEKGRHDRAYATKRKQDSLWMNFICERFGHRFIDDITSAEINDFLSELYIELKYSFGYVEAFLKMFYLIFGQAYNRNYLSQDDYNRLCINKSSKIHMPRKKSSDLNEVEVYSKSDMEKLDEYFAGRNGETAYMIGKYCGVRIGECYGILWSDINFEEDYISINKQFKVQEGLAKLVPLKTRNANRKVYMNSVLKEFLLSRAKDFEEYKVRYSAQRKQNEIMIENVDGEMISSLLLVNTLPNGKYQTDWSIKHHMRPIMQKYDIHFKFHNLRHTYGTKMALLNTPEYILLDQMGHSKSQTTHQYYLKLSEDGIVELKNNLEKMA